MTKHTQITNNTTVLAGLTVGSVSTGSIIEPIRNYCHRSDAEEVRFVEAECTEIDPVTRRLKCSDVSEVKGIVSSFELEYDRITPVTINDLELTTRSVPSLVAALGADNVPVADPWMAGEDFSLFANEVPGFFYMLGTLAPGTTSGDHHSPSFRADDSAVPIGTEYGHFQRTPTTSRPSRVNHIR